ncbi:MAG: hypothetical protein EKK64_06850 [Neisseriaceae bacterium]|nr:MAG: hypothetical protein EKK64_06850 [Neisseriaceae bacterium]
MNFKNWQILSELTQVGYQEVQNKKLFGPVYHGTTEESMSNIMTGGFKVFSGQARTGDVRHGYILQEYADGKPAPVHHLGYGIYFTQSKSIFKQYQGSGKGMKEFYLDVPRIETINFASPNTMMKWWVKNGYDMPKLKELSNYAPSQVEEIRIKATQNMTNKIKQNYDAILFKGKGLYSLLDGNQICVYDPSRIYLLNQELNDENEIFPGDKVKLKNIKGAVIVQDKRPKKYRFDIMDKILNQNSNYIYTVKIDSKTLQLLKDTYQEQARSIIENDPEVAEFLTNRMQNLNMSKEEAIQSYLDYYFSKSIALNFPERLLEKKVKKGSRIS